MLPGFQSPPEDLYTSLSRFNPGTAAFAFISLAETEQVIVPGKAQGRQTFETLVAGFEREVQQVTFDKNKRFVKLINTGMETPDCVSAASIRQYHRLADD